MAKSKVVITCDANKHPLCKCGGRFQEITMFTGQVMECEFDRDVTKADLRKPERFPGRTVTNPHYPGGEIEHERFQCSECGAEPPEEFFELFASLMPTGTEPCPVPEDFKADVEKAGSFGALSGLVEIVEAQAKMYGISREGLCWFLREKVRSKK